MSISNTETNLDIRLEIFKLARDKNKTRNLAIELIEKYKNELFFNDVSIPVFFDVKSKSFTIENNFGDTMFIAYCELDDKLDFSISDFMHFVKHSLITQLHEKIHDALQYFINEHTDELLKFYFNNDNEDVIDRRENLSFYIPHHYEAHGFLLPQHVSIQTMKNALVRYYTSFNDNLFFKKEGRYRGGNFFYENIYITDEFLNLKNSFYNNILSKAIDLQILDMDYIYSALGTNNQNSISQLLYEISCDINPILFDELLHNNFPKLDIENLKNIFYNYDKEFNLKTTI